MTSSLARRTDAIDGRDERRGLVAERVEAVRAILERRAAGGALLLARRNFAWLTVGGLNHVVVGTEIGAAGLLVTPAEVAVISPNIEAARIADEEVGDVAIDVVAVPWWDPSAIGAEAERRVTGTLLTDADLEPDLVVHRSRLSPLEQARMATIGAAVVRGLERALVTVEDGTTEEELAAELEKAVVGLRVPVLLVAGDDRIDRYRHPIPTAMAIRRRVMLVIVGERWGLHVAATRFRELVPPPPDLASRIAATFEVERAMHEATRPGATLGDVFAAAERAYAAAGVPDEWQRHHQGGTIAYQGRERIAVPGDPTLIEPGMAFAWNPSITGAKAEETFVLGPEGERRVVTAG